MTEATQQQQQPAAPTNATEAAARLDTLKADSGWGEKFLSGDVATVKEFHDLHAMIDAGDNVEMALAGITPGGDIPDSGAKLMANTATMLREIGLSDGVVRQALAGEGVPQAEFDAVTIWKGQRMRDPEFTAKYLAGDPEAGRLMTTANVVIANGVKLAEAA